MRNPAQLFRMMNEAIFILIGALFLWVAATGRYLPDPRRSSWVVLAAVLVAWGIWTWARILRTAGKAERLATKVGGVSLAIVGLIMLSLVWAPFRWGGLLLALAGATFIVRGVISAAVIALYF